MNTATITSLLILRLSVVAMADPTPTPPTHTFKDPLASIFDRQQWTVVQAVGAAFGKEHAEASVLLLKSTAPSGEDSVGSPLYAVNLLVIERGALLYSFAPLTVPPNESFRSDRLYYVDDHDVATGPPLEVRDVTGDDVPEIIFHSGGIGASDYYVEVHVLRYTPSGSTMFTAIGGSPFVETRWQKFRWIDLSEQIVALLAVSVEPSEDNCHLCPKFHKYEVYRWNSSQGHFLVNQTIPSTGKLHEDGQNPFQTDWSYIRSRLRAAPSTGTKPR